MAPEAARREQPTQGEREEVRHWLNRRRDAFYLMANVFPKSMEADYAAKIPGLKFELPAGLSLGPYHIYVIKSIGIACVFLYGEKWKEKADDAAANINWGRVTDNVVAMVDGRGKWVRPNLSREYLGAVAILAEVVGQLVGVESGLLLAIMTRETTMDHANYNPLTKNRGIAQLSRNNPLFTYAAARNKTAEGRRELLNAMRLVLPEKTDFERAREMMAGLFDAIDVKNGRQGDLMMNIIAGALTYRYKYCINTGKGRLGFAPGEEPGAIGFHRKSVEDYNGTAAKREYADAVERNQARFGFHPGMMASVPRKKEEGKEAETAEQ